MQIAVRRPTVLLPGPGHKALVFLSCHIKTEPSEQNAAMWPWVEDREKPCRLPCAPGTSVTGYLSHMVVT